VYWDVHRCLWLSSSPDQAAESTMAEVIDCGRSAMRIGLAVSRTGATGTDRVSACAALLGGVSNYAAWRGSLRDRPGRFRRAAGRQQRKNGILVADLLEPRSILADPDTSLPVGSAQLVVLLLEESLHVMGLGWPLVGADSAAAPMVIRWPLSAAAGRPPSAPARTGGPDERSCPTGRACL
jgi:hypothetical protein